MYNILDKVECLETELAHTKQSLETAEASKVIQRSEEDIANIARLEGEVVKLKEEVLPLLVSSMVKPLCLVKHVLISAGFLCEEGAD